MKKLIVLMKDVDSGCVYSNLLEEYDDIKYATNGSNVQISEIMEIVFTERNKNDVLDESLKIIDDKRLELDATYQINLDRLDAIKNNLLSLESK